MGEIFFVVLCSIMFVSFGFILGAGWCAMGQVNKHADVFDMAYAEGWRDACLDMEKKVKGDAYADNDKRPRRV